MHILIVHNGVFPALRYGGTERVLWYLGKELNKTGHKVTLLARRGSQFPFGELRFADSALPVSRQIPDCVDVVHFNNCTSIEPINKPYIVTMHGNINGGVELDANTVFVSRNHANRYGSASFVYNGLDWDDYGQPNLNAPRSYAHFLGNAAWRVKNLKGAIRVASMAKQKLYVLGGSRLNFKMGFRLTLDPNIRFAGMVGGERKLSLLRRSKALVFPVRWHEPFGLAIIESLYFGCPVLGTPYGSLPELTPPDVGFLSARSDELAAALTEIDKYSPQLCHECARDCFNSKIMATAYIEKYDAVLNGQPLNANHPKLQNNQQIKFLNWD
ncbi:MAG: glycosyltransferase [Prevotellaceae bacterium]|jgi:glycosyltransferase involved in cell wall biosynthesis|nr:glycosyltransferase [Prevotellaceae bacterium]